jgi:hypothetical protein
MNISAIGEIIAGVYIIIVGINMIQFKGHQKTLIEAAITDPEKAVQYGKQCGMAYLITGIVVVVLSVLFFVMNQIVFSGICGIFILIMFFVIRRLNWKIAGKPNVVIW